MENSKYTIGWFDPERYPRTVLTDLSEMRSPFGFRMDGIVTRPYVFACMCCGNPVGRFDRAYRAAMPHDHPEFDLAFNKHPSAYSENRRPSSSYNSAWTCSESCDRRARRRMDAGLPIADGAREATCDMCGETFPAKRSTARFCSARCRNRANYLAKAAG